MVFLNKFTGNVMSGLTRAESKPTDGTTKDERPRVKRRRLNDSSSVDQLNSMDDSVEDRCLDSTKQNGQASLEAPKTTQYDGYDIGPHLTPRTRRLSNGLDPHQTQRDLSPFSKAVRDRSLMPPPATPAHRKTPRKTKGAGRDDTSPWRPPSADDEDGEIYDNASGSSILSGPVRDVSAYEITDYDPEDTLRYALAISAPKDTGSWSAAETVLFFRLAMRGFQPLLPENWMIDFKTLPVNLFADTSASADDEDDVVKIPPFISNTYGPQFRAIRALRDLLGLGMRVRDRSISLQRLRPEPILQHAISQYLTWSFIDAKIKCQYQIGSGDQADGSTRNSSDTGNPKADAKLDAFLPVHVITSLLKGQTTSDAMDALIAKLHYLASRHRKPPNVHDNEIMPQAVLADNDLPDQQEIETQSPLLTGILICSSLVVVLTFNPNMPVHTEVDTDTNVTAHAIPAGPACASPDPPPPSPIPSSGCHVAKRPHSQEIRQAFSGLVEEESDDLAPNADADTNADADDDANTSPSRLRFIAQFDFSDRGKDVWNALAIAIVAVWIRNNMLAAAESRTRRREGEGEGEA